VTDALYNV